MDTIAIYGRWQPISDVVGRIDYITNPDRQENLLAVGGECNRNFWQRLAEDCQQAWRESGGKREKEVTKYKKDGNKETVLKEKQACEAREIQLMLPGKVLNMSKEEQKKLLQNLADFLIRKYGMTCALGLHLSRTDQNVHVHILFSERLRLVEPERRIAKRNTFLDEKGIRRRTKKEILNADGQVREGCRIVHKGEIIATRYFGEKNPLFADRDWCNACKEDLAQWINETLEPDKKRIVFDQTRPFLAQEHVGKGRPVKQKKKVEEYNQRVKAFNQMVRDRVLEEEEAQRMKSVVMLSPNRLGALGGVMAGLLLERPELQRYLRGTLMETATKAQLEDIHKMGTGGIRTNPDPDKEKKERLRQLYRQAEQMRQRARETELEFEKKRFQAEARHCSMKIDKLRRELGYYRDADYLRKLKRIEEELKWMQRRVDARRAAVSRAVRKIDYLEYEIKELQKELDELPMFWATKEIRSKRDSLQQRIKNREEEIEKLKEGEKLWRAAYYLQAVQAKKEMKRLKEEKKQLQKEQRTLRKKRNKKSADNSTPKSCGEDG